MTTRTAKIKTLNFKGRNIKYKRITDLSKKLNLTKEQAKQIIKNNQDNEGTRYFYFDGELGRFDTRKKPPVILKNRYDIKKIPNKTYAGDVKKLKGIKFFKTLPNNLRVKLNLSIKFDVRWSEEFKPRTLSRFFDEDYRKLNDINFFRDFIMTFYRSAAEVKNIKVEITGTTTQQKFKLINQKLRDKKPLKICSLFNEIIEDKNWSHCIHDFLKTRYPKISKKKINQLHTTEDIFKWCQYYNIDMIAYNINGDVISKNISKKKTYKGLYFIAHNNHLYGLKNKFLKKVSYIKYDKLNIFENNGDLLKEMRILIKSGIEPSNIMVYNGCITSFNVKIKNKKFLYQENPEYKICFDILKKFGIEDKIQPTTKLTNISDILFNLYNKEFKVNYNSFLPMNDYVKNGFYYNNGKNYNNKDLLTIDKNKAFSHILRNLDYILVCDIKRHKLINDVKTINRHYLYLAEPLEPNNLMENKNIYEGKHLIYCFKEGIKFNIIQGIETDYQANIYTGLIDDIYKKVEPKVAKDIVNRMIGKFNSFYSGKLFERVKSVVNDEEKQCRTNNYLKVDDDYNLEIENVFQSKFINKSPIRIQIIDGLNRLMYEKIKKLNIKPEQIVQIKIDSITINKNIDLNRLGINTTLQGWKVEKYKKINSPISGDRKYKTLNYISEFTDNKIGLCYAGCGKTYKILNEIIPNLIKKKLPYIVLTPSHECSIDYKKLKYNCKVIQYYTLQKKIPEEEYIIIDEVGMCDSDMFNFIINLSYLNKKIIAYGDMNQLSPVKGERCDSPLLSNFLFSMEDKLEINYRNNFSIEYYDTLINSTNEQFLKNEIKKYNSTWDEAELIICYTNSLKDKYNKLKCQKLGIQSKTDIGASLILKTNNLKDLDIYNKACLKVSRKNKDKIYLTDTVQEYELTEEQINKNFDYSYARTLYAVQGKSLKSFFYPLEEYKFLDSKGVYTLISRLKGNF